MNGKTENSVIPYKKTSNIIDDARTIINSARSSAVRSVDFCRVQMYWNLGKRIFEEEQQGKERADYGTYLVKTLVKNLEKEYGSGFGERQLERARQFYRLYQIPSALRTELNWSQYKLLIAISDPLKREYYELESANNGWTARETERQINSQLYERLLISNDKERVLAVARKERIPENPTIGILLCTAKNDEMVKMTLPKDNKTILASKYELYLPSEETLKAEVEKLANAQEKFSELTDGAGK
jgi:hypothetical protein